jgi:hypothetical protein
MTPLSPVVYRAVMEVGNTSTEMPMESRLLSEHDKTRTTPPNLQAARLLVRIRPGNSAEVKAEVVNEISDGGTTVSRAMPS